MSEVEKADGTKCCEDIIVIVGENKKGYKHFEEVRRFFEKLNIRQSHSLAIPPLFTQEM